MSPEVMGSLQYFGPHLHTPSLSYSATKAAVRFMEHWNTRSTAQRSCIQTLVNNILPGLSDFNSNLSEKEKLASS